MNMCAGECKWGYGSVGPEASYEVVIDWVVLLQEACTEYEGYRA